jgi:hypothetical protein
VAAVADAKQGFFSEYESIATDVAGSMHQFFVGNLQRWLDLIDDTPEVSDIVSAIEEKIDLDTWIKKYTIDHQGIGDGQVKWPTDRKARLGAQLSLFRAFARGDIEAYTFAMNFISTSTTNINDMTSVVARQVFLPMVNDLKRYIDREWPAIEPQSALTEFATNAAKSIPAADRNVPLDHNSAAYTEVIAALDRVASAIREANYYPDEDDKEQKQSEISAGQALLKSHRIDVRKLMIVLGSPLRQFIDKFRDTALGHVASTAWDALSSLFGALWHAAMTWL